MSVLHPLRCLRRPYTHRQLTHPYTHRQLTYPYHISESEYAGVIRLSKRFASLFW